MGPSYWEKITKERIARRRLLKSGASLSVGAAALALVGCDDDNDDGGEDTPTAISGAVTPQASPTTAPSGPTVGGTIEIGALVDLVGFEPHVTNILHTKSIWQVWERLTRYGPDLDPTGQLAESWEVNDDATEFVFHVREGATWHSGREFTSDDINWNLLRVRNPDAPFGLFRTQSNWFEEIEIPDPKTIILRSATPRPLMFDFLETFNMGDQETLADQTKLVGTGGYMIGEWRPGEKFNLLRNPEWWNIDNGAYLDEQVWHTVLDPQTMVSQFESGALDLIDSPPINDYVRWRDGNEYSVYAHDSTGSFTTAGFNTTYEPLYDKRVRQALQHTIDRETFSKTILKGVSESYSLPWPKASLAYEASKEHFYKFDLDKAKAMLTEAGVSGLDMTLLLTPNAPELIEFAEVWQADLAKVGVGGGPEVLEVAAWVEKVNADPPNYNGAYLSPTNRANLGAPISMIITGSVIWSTVVKGDANGHPFADNNTGFYSDEYKELVDTIVAESSPEVLKGLYSKLNDVILDESWVAILAPRPPTIAATKKVLGVKNFSVLEAFDFTQMYLEV